MPSPTNTTGPFILTRATTPQDLLEVVHCEYTAFTDPTLLSIFMGPNTPSNHAHLARTYHNTMAHDTGDLWLKVQEKETGKVVGASNWKVYVGCVPEHKEELRWEWLQGEGQEVELAKAKGVVQGILETRRRLFIEPYVQLHICFVDPAYQRRGIGAMMLKWGCDLADQLFLPAWVEASPMGNYLYRRFGFRDVEINEEGDVMQGSVMRREAKVEPIEGGKEVAVAEGAMRV